MPALARVEGGVTRAMPDTLRGRTALERAWDGIRLFQVEAEAQETPEGILLNHLVVMNLGAEATCGSRFEGRGWEAHRVPHHGVSVFPADVPYAMREDSPREFLLLEIAREFADDVLRPPPPGAALRPVIGAEDAFAVHVLLALGEEARGGRPYGEVRARGLGAALVTHLACRDLGEARPALVPELPSPKLRRVLDHVACHLDAPLTLRLLAELAGMDLFRFVRAFKQATGLSPHRYVLEARIGRARELLRDRSLSITEIALRTGFATPSHFSVTFRRMTNATPRAFRDALPP